MVVFKDMPNEKRAIMSLALHAAPQSEWMVFTAADGISPDWVTAVHPLCPAM